MLFDTEKLVNQDFVFTRTLLSNGDCQFNFGKDRLGKIFLDVNGREVTKRMQGTVVVPKQASINLEVSAKTMMNHPTVFEVFRQDKVTGLTIGKEGIDDLVSDSSVSSDEPQDSDPLQRGLVYVQLLKHLQLICIQTVSLNKLGLGYLALDSYPDLTSLRLAKTPLTGADIANLKVLQRLRTIDVMRMKNILPLSRALQKSKVLESYNLETCDIGDADLEPIGKFKAVKALNLSYNPRITSKGLHYLERLPVLKLNLVETKVGPEAIPVLVKMRLKELELPKELWSTADLERLRRLMPKCDARLYVKDQHIIDEN